jgi:hypothetical protein
VDCIFGVEYLQLQRVAELERVLQSRGAAVSRVYYASYKHAEQICTPVVKRDRSKIPHRDASLLLEREVGAQPVVVLAVRVDGRVVCHPLPIEFPDSVHFIVVEVEARGDTPEARERYAWDLVHAAASVLKYSVYIAELRAKLPLAWALYGFSARSGGAVEVAVPEEPDLQPDPPALPAASEAQAAAVGAGAAGVERIVDMLLRDEGVDPATVHPAVRQLLVDMLKDPLAALARRLGVRPEALADCARRT